MTCCQRDVLSSGSCQFGLYYNHITGSYVVRFPKEINTKPVSRTLRTVVVKLVLFSDAFRLTVEDFSLQGVLQVKTQRLYLVNSCLRSAAL